LPSAAIRCVSKSLLYKEDSTVHERAPLTKMGTSASLQKDEEVGTNGGGEGFHTSLAPELTLRRERERDREIEREREREI